MLVEKNYEAYVPNFFIQEKRVIKNVDIEILETKLKKLIKPQYGENFKIVNAERMIRKVNKDN